MPARSSPNSRVPRSGMTNWLTADHASAMITPSANIRRTIGGSDGRPGGIAEAAPAEPGADASAPSRAGK